MYSMKAWSTILAPLTATCTLQLKIRMLLLYAVRIRRIREASVFIFKKIVLVIAFYFRKVPYKFSCACNDYMFCLLLSVSLNGTTLALTSSGLTSI